MAKLNTCSMIMFSIRGRSVGNKVNDSCVIYMHNVYTSSSQECVSCVLQQLELKVLNFCFTEIQDEL